MTIDPLDAGNPGRKRWEEFRAQYAAALLSYWVFRDLEREAADAVEGLWARLQSSLLDYPEIIRKDTEEEGHEWDGYVPFHGPDDSHIDWLHVDDLCVLLDSLFPHDLGNASIGSAFRGSTVVGLHSALEAYAKQMGVSVVGGLVNGIRQHLAGQGRSLNAELLEALDNADATRHVIVHNRGCVDERYIRQVRDSHLLVGEQRPLPDELIESFARAISEVAHFLRASDGRVPSEGDEP